MRLTEGNILVEDIKKMASQTEEDSEQEETARWLVEEEHALSYLLIYTVSSFFSQFQLVAAQTERSVFFLWPSTV